MSNKINVTCLFVNLSVKYFGQKLKKKKKKKKRKSKKQTLLGPEIDEYLIHL